MASPVQAATIPCSSITNGLSLTADTTATGCAVTFSSNATINLNGHTLSIAGNSGSVVKVTGGTLTVVGGGTLKIDAGWSLMVPPTGLTIASGAALKISGDVTVAGGTSFGLGGTAVNVASGGALTVSGSLTATGGVGGKGSKGTDSSLTVGGVGSAGGSGGIGLVVDGTVRASRDVEAKGGKGGDGGTGGNGKPGSPVYPTVNGANGGSGGAAGPGGSAIVGRGIAVADQLLDAMAGYPGEPGTGGLGGFNSLPGLAGAVASHGDAFQPLSASAVIMAPTLGTVGSYGVDAGVMFRTNNPAVSPGSYFAYAATVGAAEAAFPSGWPGAGFIGWFFDDGTPVPPSAVPSGYPYFVYAHWADAPDPGTPDPGSPDGECAPFGDVTASNPNCDDIAWLKAQGIVSSTAATYRPDAALTRGQLVTFLFKVANPGKAKPKCTVKPFKDVKKKSAVCGYVKWAKNKGIVTGAASAKFKASATVTRGAAAVYLYRMTHKGKAAPTCKAKPFKDVGKKSAKCGAVKWMKASNIDSGVTATKYKPGKVTTRGAFASTLRSLSQYLA